MSADNGIYIAEFPKEDGTIEYRVAHAQAIENVDYGTTQEQDAYRAAIFGEARCFSNKDDAILFAHKEEESYDILEYGVSRIRFDRPLVNMTKDQIKDVLGF